MSCTADRALNPEAFRRLIQTQGQQIRYWRAMLCTCNDSQNADYKRVCPNHDKYGYIYEEVTLDSAVRAYIYNAKSSILHPDLGWIKVTSTYIETMPDEIFLTLGDKVLSTKALMAQKETRKRGSTNSDELSQLFVSSIDVLYSPGATYIKDTDYQLVVNATTGASSVKWIGNAPDENKVYSLIYKYHPIYWALGQQMSPPRPSQFDGVPLVFKCELSLKHPSEAG